MATVATSISAPPESRSTESGPSEPGPAWQIATLFPNQGHIGERDYLIITDHARRLAEYTDGQIEVLPMPTTEHQEIVLFLVNLLRAFIAPRNLGRALMSPLRVKLRDGIFREPDVVFLATANVSRIGNRYWNGADLVMEVISEDDPNRDLVEKRRDYAQAGIAEYWIVDPRTRIISVLKLQGTEYITHSEFTGAGTLRSALLAGFTADVAAVFAAAEAAR